MSDDPFFAEETEATSVPPQMLLFLGRLVAELSDTAAGTALCRALGLLEIGHSEVAQRFGISKQAAAQMVGNIVRHLHRRFGKDWRRGYHRDTTKFQTEPGLLGLREAAKFLGISSNRVRHLVTMGTLHPALGTGGRHLFAKRELLVVSASMAASQIASAERVAGEHAKEAACDRAKGLLDREQRSIDATNTLARRRETHERALLAA